MTTPGSGNRWEPAAAGTPEDTALLHAGSDPEPRSTPRTSRRWAARVPRPRLRVVGLVAAFLLLGGVAGFLIGHATVGHGTEGVRFAQLDHRGPTPGHDRFGHDRSDHDGFGDDDEAR